MEVECLALKDLTSPRIGFPVVTEEDVDQTEQKENICTDRPLKSSEPAFLPMATNRKGGTAIAADLAHITPIKHSTLTDPWTPTANLKMLISAMSPDIRDREMRKVLFRPIENEKPASPDTAREEVEESGQFDVVDEEDEASPPKKQPSRKQRSLGLLCQKFLALYPDYPPPHCPICIPLDEVATSLGAERRRIYDIVNVLESLAIVGRIAKNCYTWYGRQHLETTLEELQQHGQQQGYHLQMELAAEAREAETGCKDDGGEGDASSAGGNRKVKFLRIMSQRFVMLFLVSKTQTVTLDAAAKILIEESQDSSSHSKSKTKVRRLYDIANILTSLSLIKKVHVREGRVRKPAFKWLGPVEFKNRGKYGPPSQPVDYSRKTTGNSAVCQLQFGSDDRSGTAHQPPSAAPLATPLLATPLLALFPPSSSSSPQCLAYLPSLCQPSVVMLYRPLDGPDAAHRADSEEGMKRKREDEDEGGLKKKGMSGSEGGVTREAEECSPPTEAMVESRGDCSSEPVQPSHYLYVPNNTGLQSLNFFLSAGQSPASLTLPPNGVPTVALPYVLVPSTALPHYPLVAGGLQQQGSDSHGKLSFGLPAAAMSPARLTLAATAAPDAGSSPVPLPSTPEQCIKYGSAAGTPHSPQRQTVGIGTPEPLTPHTPNDTMASASKAFFQTPGTLGSLVGSVPAPRRRGSAQRRLDVGHQPTSQES